MHTKMKGFFGFWSSEFFAGVRRAVFVSLIFIWAPAFLLWYALLAWPPEDSGQIAAWVQAVGSILAVFIAIFVSKHQSDLAVRLHEKGEERQGNQWQREVEEQNALRKQKAAAIMGVIDRFCEMTVALNSAIRGPHLCEGKPLIDIRLSCSIEDFSMMISVMKSVNVIELNSYDAARTMLSIISYGEEIVRYWNQAISDEVNQEEWLSLASPAISKTVASCPILKKSLNA